MRGLVGSDVPTYSRDVIIKDDDNFACHTRSKSSVDGRRSLLFARTRRQWERDKEMPRVSVITPVGESERGEDGR